MDVFKRALGSISGGRVLDVATGAGGFIEIFKETLESYTEIIGIDTRGFIVQAAPSPFDAENVRYVQMDGAQMGFENGCFDTVNVSASLHHLTNASQILAEMKRVLRPGGRLIVAEMHRDGQTEPQMTSVCIHHWAAEVDSALGVVHNKTWGHQEIVDFVTGLGLCNVELYDFADGDSDPKDQEAIEQVAGYIDRYILRVEELPNPKALKERGEELRQQLYEVGMQREPILVIIGEK